MLVERNSLRQMFRAFLGWIPMLVLTIPFYLLVFVIVGNWALSMFMPADIARAYAWIVGSVGLLIFALAYLRYVSNLLGAYVLKLENDVLCVEGSPGWRLVKRALPLGSIDRIVIGDTFTKIDQIVTVTQGGKSSLLGEIKAGTLVFFPKNEKPFKMVFADKAFNRESLEVFLLNLRSRGLCVEVSA
ncbi:MAG: hypothetical protein K2Y28_14340 [Burkholderiaceae bacterium]|nr:hypothetical protein [Burkholderiaceae bacterium]